MFESEGIQHKNTKGVVTVKAGITRESNAQYYEEVTDCSCLFIIFKDDR